MDEKIEVDWGLSIYGNRVVNEILNEINRAEEEGRKFDVATVQVIVRRLVAATIRHWEVGEAAEQAVIWALTGKDKTSWEAGKVAPFVSRPHLREMVDIVKHNLRTERM